jgi:hypothetical protein
MDVVEIRTNQIMTCAPDIVESSPPYARQMLVRVKQETAPHSAGCMPLYDCQMLVGS